MMSIKSDKARNFAEQVRIQIPQLSVLLDGDLHMDIDIYYASRRPDLDESALLDALQGLVYANDRQVKSRRVRWGLDKENPRVEFSIREITPQDYAGGIK